MSQHQHLVDAVVDIDHYLDNYCWYYLEVVDVAPVGPRSGYVGFVLVLVMLSIVVMLSSPIACSPACLLCKEAESTAVAQYCYFASCL